jgi:glycerol-3-phosphate dehydrogenase
MFFVIPWGDQSLIGTTDLDDSSPPEAVTVTAGEVDYLLGEAARHLSGIRLSGADVVSSFAGIRPLLAGRPGQASALSREHALFETADGLLAIAGGKYTTYRAMAAEVADRVMTRLGRPRGTTLTDCLPLPGGAAGWAEAPAAPAASAQRYGLDAAALRRLIDRYGSRTGHLLELLAREPELAAPVAAALPLLQAEVAYAADFEMARTPEDVLRRRSPQALLPGHGLNAVETVAALLGRRLSLPSERLAATVAGYRRRFSS